VINQTLKKNNKLNSNPKSALNLLKNTEKSLMHMIKSKMDMFKLKMYQGLWKFLV